MGARSRLFGDQALSRQPVDQRREVLDPVKHVIGQVLEVVTLRGTAEDRNRHGAGGLGGHEVERAVAHHGDAR